MLLSDFLKTVPELTNEQKRDAAKAYTVVVGNMLESTTVNGWLSAFKLLPIVKQVAEDATHPAHSDLLAVWVALHGNHPFNFKIGNMTGDGQIAALNRLINTDLTEHAAALTMFKDTALYFANTVTYPLAKTELYDVLYAIGECPTKPITHVNGWYTVTTSSDVPLHHPEIRALNTRTGKWQRVTSLYNLSAAGTYEQRVPNEWLSAELCIENAYGVL